MSQRYEQLRCDLNADVFLRQAREISGLHDYGDDCFIAPLKKLLDCVARDVNLRDSGLKEFQNEIVRDLINRLRFQSDLQRHPEIRDEDVSDPIVILGLPRSGTTKTQRMFGVDDGLQHMYMWQFLNPAPFPNAAHGQPDPRIAAATRTDRLAADNAGAQAAHHMANDQVEEDWGIFETTFNNWYFNARVPSRSWHEWVLSRNEPSDLDNYRYVKSLFQYLQWQMGGKRGRRRVMKNVSHHGYLDELLAVFPNATLIHVHRHPSRCLPSMAKMLHQLGKTRVAELEPRFIGGMVFELWKLLTDRYLEARDRLRLDDRILDVPYEQIRGDAIATFREIYRHAGLELTPEVELRMRQWEADNEQGKHGEHRYSLEEVGYSETMIADGFAAYIWRFHR